jgi:hypothetical protein
MRDVVDVARELERCQNLWEREGYAFHDPHPKFLEFCHRLDERGKVLDWVLADSNRGGDLSSLQALFDQCHRELEEADQGGVKNG